MTKLKENRIPLLFCFFELVIGVLLLVDPAGFTMGIIVAGGAALIVWGIVNAVRYFKLNLTKASKGMYLTKGLLLMLLGGFCVFRTAWFLETFSALTTIFGVAILLMSVKKTQLFVDLLHQKNPIWKPAAISTLVSFVCAVVILYNPFASASALWVFTGLFLILDAAFDAAAIFRERKGKFGEVPEVCEADEQGKIAASEGITIPLSPDTVTPIRTMDERLVSYNIEMTEVTGGTFWKKYTPGQIAGTEEFPPIKDIQDVTAMAELMQYYPPIDLYNERLRELAKKLGPAWIRVSGTWATKTYYDFDGTTGGKAPEGYASVLTKEQWIGVLDFVKYVGGKLLISVSNCAGDHPDNGPLDLTQAKKIFAFSYVYGVEIDAVEFMNEPNMLEMSGAPAGYGPEDYARDQDILYTWVRSNYPNCLLVGPCTTGDPSAVSTERGFGAGIGSLARTCTTAELLAGTTVPLDVFSYHYYNGVSERLASMMPNAHWSGELAHSDEYLAVAPECAKSHARIRNRLVPGVPMWVTESGDAGGGGDTWASTYLDVLRTLNELGSFSTITDGVIFHNTLASSDYGFLEHGSYRARPNYFAVLLWNRLMGETVYDCGNPGKEGAHIYCHSRKDRKPGVVYLIINNSLSKETVVEIPKKAERYTLSAQNMRSSVVEMNGKELVVSGIADIPELIPMQQNAGPVTLTPGSCTFLVM